MQNMHTYTRQDKKTEYFLLFELTDLVCKDSLTMWAAFAVDLICFTATTLGDAMS